MPDNIIDSREILARIRAERATQSSGHCEWPEPKPLPNGLAPVEPFSSDFLPDALAPWIEDIANRLQCPPDYVAVAALTSLGAVTGRRIGVKPQQQTPWVEVPNVWGYFVGRPGLMKSPAMLAALSPIYRLEAEAAKENEIAQKAYGAGLSAYKIKAQVAAMLAKKELKKTGKADDLKFDPGEEPEEPLPTRYRTNDSSYEAIGELLIANPTGILIERDELVSLLQHLDREDQSVARGFYLTAWSGLAPYTFDRIVRGHRHIEAACVSVLGNTQPARIIAYVRRANYGGAGGDGLLQRFGLAVWPDAPSTWRDVDTYPSPKAREMAWQVYERISKIDTNKALALGAEKGSFDNVPGLRLNEDAHQEFLEWRTDHERLIRSDEISPALEGHLAKYRKLVPALALLNHLAAGATGLVSREALLKALAFAHYLQSHARRIYGAGYEAEVFAAKAILKRIAAGNIADGFTARDVYQHGWAHLSEREQVAAGLGLLGDLGYLAVSVPPAGPGRPKVTYRINPKVAS
jgi:uncharacterized protein DUF3987